MGYRHNGVNTGGLPIEYIKTLLVNLDVPVFIETGTAGGESVRQAAQVFKTCHTIEIVEGRASGEYPSNVNLHTGDSGQLLFELADRYKKEWVFFWLDAHWSEPHASEEEVEECPLLKEIDSINHAKSIIMIDDARLFFGPVVWPCDPRKWPTLKDIFQHLQWKFPDHIISIVDDYIVCLPQELKHEFYSEWRGRYYERYPSNEMKLKNAVRLTYNAFKEYIK